MSEALTPWGDAGFWVELEENELKVYRLIKGKLESAFLGRADGEHLLLLKGWNFLQPLGPVRAQRVTIEEPPRTKGPGRT